MNTIVIGLGNPILGDDGVGWKVAEEVKRQLPPDTPVAMEFLSLGGISLMEHLIGYQRAILIDAITSDQEPGTVTLSKLSEMPDYSALHTTSPHDTSLQNALRLGKMMGADLPEEIIVVGIVARHIYDFSEELSVPVAQAIPEAVQNVIRFVT